jgi:hypothetical protein
MYPLPIRKRIFEDGNALGVFTRKPHFLFRGMRVRPPSPTLARIAIAVMVSREITVRSKSYRQIYFWN